MRDKLKLCEYLDHVHQEYWRLNGRVVHVQASTSRESSISVVKEAGELRLGKRLQLSFERMAFRVLFRDIKGTYSPKSAENSSPTPSAKLVLRRSSRRKGPKTLTDDDERIVLFHPSPRTSQRRETGGICRDGQTIRELYVLWPWLYKSRVVAVDFLLGVKWLHFLSVAGKHPPIHMELCSKSRCCRL